MKSWTRTLNIDDAHTLLALAEPGLHRDAWVAACHEHLPGLSVERRREVIRLVRDGFVDWSDGVIRPSGFLAVYAEAPASAQLDLVLAQWAVSHPLPVRVARELLAPALERGDDTVALDVLDDLVRGSLDTDSWASIRKTRTTVIGALEGIGALESRGTGQHRSLHPRRGVPHPTAYAWLLRRELAQRGAEGMMRSEAEETALPRALTNCSVAHAVDCIEVAVQRGQLQAVGDEIRALP